MFYGAGGYLYPVERDRNTSTRIKRPTLSHSKCLTLKHNIHFDIFFCIIFCGIYMHIYILPQIKLHLESQLDNK